MIRPLTCVCMLLAGGSGLYLYQSKHRAQMLDREIERTLKATDTAKDRIGVLRGEWALLNEPERLAGLSQSHLGLKTLMPGQFVTAAELGARLPPVVVPDTVQMPGEDEPSTSIGEIFPTPPAPAPSVQTPAPGVPTRPIAAAVKAAPVPPSAPPRAPAQIASALQPPASPLPRPVPPRSVLAPIIDVSASPIAAASVPKPVPPRPANTSSASAGQGVASARPAAPSPGGTSIGESVLRAARLRGGAQAANTDGPAPQPANNAPARSEPSSSPATASALGGARPPLPRPVPLGSATAGSLASVR